MLQGLLALFLVWPMHAAEVQFPKKQLRLAGRVLSVEVAETTEQLTRGLMFRKKLGQNEGMLFIYPEERTLSFWMRNTFVPLSIGFFNKNQELIDIQDMQPVKSEMETHPPSYQSKAPAKYALEVPQGWFARHKVKLRARFELVSKK